MHIVAVTSLRFIFFIIVSAGGFLPATSSAAKASAPSPSPLASPAESAGKAGRAADAVETTTSSEVPSSAVEPSVVKVFSTVRYPALYKPWTKQAPSDVTGTGVVISGKRILTNAHVVLYASEVQIQGHQGGDKIAATVESVVQGIDLAILRLDDDSFFDSHRPLPLAKVVPAVQEAVMVYGFPTGGTSLSVTKGIVSRIEFSSYTYPVSGLRIQIDAAINAGNSGGPAVVADKMVGLAFSRLDGSENIGYIIPSEEIELFLNDLADGRYDGKPAMYDELQTLENPALRAFLKLDKSTEGIVVHKPDSADPNYPLKEWDVITRIGDAAIDNQGMVQSVRNLRVRFQYLVQKIAKQGTVPLTVIRGGRQVRVALPVSSDRLRLMPNLRGGQPEYFICGPLVFSEATSQLVGDYADGSKAADWMLDLSYNANPVLARAGDKPAFEGERLVFVASPAFPHKLAKGYSNPSQQVVKTLNGQSVKNLAHLVELLRDSKDAFIALAFNMRGGETVVFPRAEMLAATNEILDDNGIRSQGSPDMLAIWNKK